jgi:superfamily II DNA or RNA helicase
VTDGLRRLVAGSLVHGVVAQGPVEVVAAVPAGASAVRLTYRDAHGDVAERLVFAEEAEGFRVEAGGRAWTFDADGDDFKLVAEARRLRMAHLFDPMLAVHLSQVEPLPHQIQAVYGTMLGRQPLRFCLADDPGAGKTIMAGLLIKELMLRGDLARCLIVAPGGLVAQWQDELMDKLGTSFTILTKGEIDASRSGDPFADRDLLIARLDHLARNEDLQAKLEHQDWDLVVVDEAHRMSAHYFGSELKETKRYKLGKLLAGTTRHFLLMTATPHAGKDEDFQLFLALLDGDRFEGRARDASRADTSDLMLRRVKEDLLTFEGKRLFPERRASSVPYPLSPGEARLYHEVTTYVAEEMGRADRLAAEGEGRRGNRVGFAVTVLQRRLASSPEAIYQSLCRRRKRLEARLGEERTASRGREFSRLADAGPEAPDPEDWEELDAEEAEQLEELVMDDATAARTIAELELEIATLRRLESVADEVRRAGEDRKWVELRNLLADRPEMFHHDGRRRKLIVFTEHRDTLDYLTGRIRDLLGRPEAVVTIHGGTPRDERRRVQEVFTQDKDCLVLVATDAAGEGLNLQVAHLLVNYDLPWNPNRIEQRFGRVHRIGQTEVCHLWNLVAEDTREGQVYARLLDKLEEQRKALGGQVWDVLGEAFPGRSLQDLLIDAVRYGDDPRKRAELEHVIDATVGDGLGDLVRQHALNANVWTAADLQQARTQLALAEARRLQPHYVQAFFVEAFARLGGRLAEREPGRFELTTVPQQLRLRDREIGSGAPVLRRYARACFERDLVHAPGKPPAELVGPGHPLLEALVDLTLERDRHLLARGAVFVDPADWGTEPVLLAFLEHTITDATTDRAGRPRVVSRRFEFVRITPSGSPVRVGSAPYLDVVTATPAQATAVRSELDRIGWPGADAERIAADYGASVAAPAHLQEVRSVTQHRVERVRAAVKQRLLSEIDHWDQRANELAEQEAAGRQPRMNPDRARQRADALQARLKRRLAELDAEAQVVAMAPVLVGAAIIAPAGLLAERNVPLAFEVGDLDRSGDTAATERAAVDAVLRAERALGRRPTEMPHNNPGFDIESLDPDGDVWHLEVKGRIQGGRTFVVTHNELRHAMNRPERYLLAMVEVDPSTMMATEVRYVARPFGTDVTSIRLGLSHEELQWAPYWDRGVVPSGEAVPDTDAAGDRHG